MKIKSENDKRIDLVQHRLNNLKQVEVFVDDYKRENKPVPESFVKELHKAQPQMTELERAKQLLEQPVSTQDIIDELEKMKERLAEGKTKTLIKEILDSIKEQELDKKEF